MKGAYTFLFFLCVHLSVTAQEAATDDWVKILSYGVGHYGDQRTLSLEEADRRSDQCIPEYFAKASLLLNNNTQVESAAVKYDFKEKALLILVDNEVIVVAPKMVNEIQFHDGNHLPLIHTGQLGRTYGRMGFYSVLLSENNNYLLKYSTFEEKKVVPNSSVTTTDVYEGKEEEPEFVKSEEILLSKAHELYLLENFKSKTLGQFNAHADALKGFIKKEKLKFKNPEDLKKFASYYWSL